MQQLWAQQLVESLVQQGVTWAVFGSGYRLTPLLVALRQNPHISLHHHMDERGAAFRALGWARATGKPALVVTTSGTAVANLLPAIAEAYLDRVPLIVMTADRPGELLHCGANQAMDQLHIFGHYVKHFVNLSLTESGTTDRYLSSAIAQACRYATMSQPGPVHINCAWREPLEPTAENVARPALQTCQTIEPNYRKMSLPADLVDLFQKNTPGYLLVGSGLSDRDGQAILQLSEALGWPVLPDVLSGLRFHPEHPHLLFFYEELLRNQQLPQVNTVIAFGRRFVSKSIHDWLSQSSVETYVEVVDDGQSFSVGHGATHHFSGPVHLFCQTLAKDIKAKANPQFVAELKKNNQAIGHQWVERYDRSENVCDVSYVRALLAEHSKDRGLFVSNSLPIRLVDRFAPQVKHRIGVAANRGASGIDGILSTALGYAQGLNRPTTLLTGDMAFLYDVNALQAIAQSEVPLCIVVLNNNGGGIFEKLPIKQALSEEDFNFLYQTPHDADLRELAAAFMIDYVAIDQLETFARLYRDVQNEDQTIVMDVSL